MTNFWNRALNLGRGGAASPLQTDLRRITDAELLESPPKDVLLSVTTATNVEDDRREIMLHLQECLAETSSKRWRRVHGGLVLLEHLLRHGSPAVVAEIAEGRHFDPVQRLTFLEKFEYGDDRRVQNVVRQKATALRAEMLTRLQDPHAAPAERPAAASSSKGSTSPVAKSAEASGGGRFVGFGSDGPADADKATSGSLSGSPYVGFGSDSCPTFDQGSGSKSKVVNGLVNVGHRDDTDSESEDEGRRRRQKEKAVNPSSTKAGGPVRPPDRRKPMEDSTDSESDRERRGRRKARSPKSAAPKPAPAAEADLLGGFDDSPAAKPAPPAPAKQEDLLEGMFGDSAPAAQPKPPAPAGGGDLLDF